jgi:hypothetical protein
MNNSQKAVLMFLTCASVSVMAQTSGQSSIQREAGPVTASAPQCAVTNFDEAKNAFTVKNPVAGAVNQQCFFTVMPKDQSAMGSVLPVLSEYPAPRLMEGQYIVTLSGGGGGGGAGHSGGGGGGGAGALPAQVTRYLAPGIYRMTLGTGGEGGIACQTAANGGSGGQGNPTSLSEAYTGNIVAGFPRAEYWAGAPSVSPTMGARSGDAQAVSTTTPDGRVISSAPGGQGAAGVGGQSSGGAGGLVTSANVAKGQDGGTLGQVAFPGTPGEGGNGFIASGARAPLAGGGGGGAGYGHGGDGQSAVPGSKQAMAGELGAGGGAGAGGTNMCGAGAPGGHGFIALRPA